MSTQKRKAEKDYVKPNTTVTITRSVFPPEIRNLPLAEVPFQGATAYLSQAEDHQITFMQFEEDLQIPKHVHKSQWGVVFEGTLELTINGHTSVYRKGARYYIPDGVPHSARVHAGLQVMDWFSQPDLYAPKV